MDVIMKLDAGENQNIEYKESWRDEYLKWVCGFANAKGGKIYIGVNDDCKIVGVKGAKQLMEDIPKEALREILYNAVTHKDYTGVHIQMHVYADRLEVWNDGELPLGYTEETLLGDHSSKPRNRNIANAMFMAGFIDRWGRGYKKIRDGFTAAGMPMPKVENFCGGVRVSVERTKYMELSNVTGNVVSDVVSDVSSLSVVQLSERQMEICKLIKKNSFVSATEMSVVLSVTHRTIQRDLADLQKKRVIIREGNTSAGHWVLLKSVD